MLILKSASPRRKQILGNLKLQFKVDPSHVDENALEAEIPLDYLKRVSIAKLDLKNANPDSLYIASDTIVVLDNQILGKPRNLMEGQEILSLLSGKTHSVYSGLAISKNSEVFYDFDETKVKFKDLTNAEIDRYLEDSKPFDKAGSYGIQDVGTPVIECIGSYTNVLGFPIRKFYKYFDLWKEYLHQNI